MKRIEKYIITNGDCFIARNCDGIYKTHKQSSAFCSGLFKDYIPIFEEIENLYPNENWYLEKFEEVRNRNIRHHNQCVSKNESKKRKKICKNIKIKLYDECGGICPVCGHPMYLESGIDDVHMFTIDHIIPLDKGGKNELSNYKGMCRTCNQIKNNIMPLVFANHLTSVFYNSIVENREYQKIILGKIIQNKLNYYMASIKSLML